MEGKPGPAEEGEEEEAGGREGMAAESSSVRKAKDGKVGKGGMRGEVRTTKGEGTEMDEFVRCSLSLEKEDERESRRGVERMDMGSPPSSGKSVEGRSKEVEGAS